MPTRQLGIWDYFRGDEKKDEATDAASVKPMQVQADEPKKERRQRAPKEVKDKVYLPPGNQLKKSIKELDRSAADVNNMYGRF
jgi:hypothetical protein